MSCIHDSIAALVPIKCKQSLVSWELAQHSLHLASLGALVKHLKYSVVLIADHLVSAFNAASFLNRVSYCTYPHPEYSLFALTMDTR